MQHGQGLINRAAAVSFLGLVLGAPLAQAGAYDFTPAPQTDLNRIYRIDRAMGEVSACQYGLQEGSVGATLCFGPGEGAGGQPAGDYGLVGSRHEREGGVFRVNFRSGEMSICYVFESKVVCTPQANPTSPAPAAAVRPPQSGATTSPGTR
ncbi:hypothetical protein [Salinarimonas soli]|uniref:Uncharacterized protein n=1 Tax=Salinarimonas soli TaxID=1638099 RepID=A0A5B2VE29_9HYPH|nr:hypothetical protein [Salinarimonas soli]KAA2237035.1 hypothetical protein F0L46_12270 [Salinarimonas soli]